jgi:hypothetical protein
LALTETCLGPMYLRHMRSNYDLPPDLLWRLDLHFLG